MTDEGFYQDALVSLARAAAGAGRLPFPGGAATLDNPLCGDRVTFEVSLRDGRIAELAHRVRGCILCEASASFLGRAAPGATPADIGRARAGAVALLKEGASPPEGAFADLRLFAPVGPVASRHGCVLLPFDALAAALARAEG